MDTKFRALKIIENQNIFERHIVEKSISELPESDILIRVKYSSLNYKDALSASGNKGVTRNYPHTPGIDAAGIVERSNSDKFKPGDQVLVTGYDLGMNTSGGFAQYISVPADWVVKLPEDLTLEKSMSYGTAGFTAALSIYKLIVSGVKAGDGDILVTGATGGVASIAISLLDKLGYSVVAATGRLEEKERLIGLGAKEVIQRTDIDDNSSKALLKARWAGVIDTVGGNILATALKSTSYNGTVTCCGNVASHELKTSVYPFILRGVSLIGIDSVQCDMETRLKVWEKLSRDWKIDVSYEVVSLEEISEKIDLMLSSKHTGRCVLKL